MSRLIKVIVASLIIILSISLTVDAGPLKALIVTGQSSQYHNWKVSSPILKELLEQTGLFKVDVATSPQRGGDMANFKPVFADYNVVVLDYEGDDWSQETKVAFVEYVKAGGGVVIFHSTNNAFPGWGEFNEIIGLGGWGERDEKWGPMVRYRDGKVVFDNTPGKAGSHPPKQDFQIIVRDSNHPVTAGLPQKWMHASDELYGQLRGPAKNLTVLATAYSDPAKQGGTGENEPILFTINYGQGRVFHTVLGHVGAKDEPPIAALDCVGFIATFKRGAEWAASGKVTQNVPEDFPTEAEVRLRQGGEATKSIDELLREAASYEFGQSRKSLTELEDVIRDSYGSQEQRKNIEKLLMEFLRSNATLAGKQFICKQLSIIGTEEAVPALAAMLTEANTADMARYALERICGAAVDEALREALPKTTGKARVGIINTLGMRGDDKSVLTLSGLIYDSDSEAAGAAISALGRIGGDQAAEALAKAEKKVDGKLQPMVLDAYLNCAAQFAAQGKQKEALNIYNELYKAGEAVPIRSAALRGIALVSPEEAAEIIINILKGDDKAMQSAAIGLVREMPHIDAAVVSSELPRLSAAPQVQLLSALADRGDAGALRQVTRATKSANSEVRIAALQALGELGDASSVGLLAKTAATAKGDEQEVARESLYRLRGPQIDESIIASIPKANAGVKVELIRSIGERNTGGAVETLLKTAQDKNDGVRQQSIKALRDVAGAEHIPTLVDLLINARSEAELKEAERTVISVSRKFVGEKDVTAAVLKAITFVKDTKIRCSLLSVLGGIGNREGLGTLRAALKNDNAEVRTAAIRALSDWPNAEPAADLRQLAASSSNETEKTMALRGFIRLIGQQSDRPAEEAVEMYKQAMELASNVEEKKLVLSGLANIKSFAAMYMASGYLKDDALHQEAGTAMLKIAEFTRQTDPQQTKILLRMLIQVAKSDSLREEAQKALEQIK